MVGAASVESEVSLTKLKEFIPEKRPNYIKAIRKWNKGLTESHNDLLALASFTAAAEKANQIMAAGKDVVSDVSATMAASREKMSGVLSNAVTSCTGGPALAELLSTRKQSDILALRFDIQSNSLDLKC